MPWVVLSHITDSDHLEAQTESTQSFRRLEANIPNVPSFTFTPTFLRSSHFKAKIAVIWPRYVLSALLLIIDVRSPSQISLLYGALDNSRAVWSRCVYDFYYPFLYLRPDSHQVHMLALPNDISSFDVPLCTTDRL